MDPNAQNMPGQNPVPADPNAGVQTPPAGQPEPVAQPEPQAPVEAPVVPAPEEAPAQPAGETPVVNGGTPTDQPAA